MHPSIMRRLIPTLALLMALATAAAPTAILAQGPSAPSIPITTVRLGDLVEARRHSAPATIVASNSPALSSEISARIEDIPVRVGDSVESGAVLARLDCRLNRSHLAAAEAGVQRLAAQRDFSDSQLQRARGLQAKRGISDELVEQRVSELASLEAQVAAQRESLAQAAIDVERCEVRAPFAAVVTERLADVGGLAAPGTPLVRLVQLGDLEVSAALHEDETVALEGTTDLAFVYQDQAYPARLRALLPVVEPRARTREARLTLLETAGVPAGAAGRLVWQEPAPMLPADYLVRRDGRLGIFYVNGEVAHFHVMADALEGRPAILDLPADTRLVVEGRQRLRAGDAVTEVSAQAAD